MAWVSVAVAVVHGLLAWSLPTVPRVVDADDTKRFDGAGSFAHRYVEMLRSGAREMARHRPLRRLALVGAVAIFATVAAGSSWVAVSTLRAIVTLPVLAIAAAFWMMSPHGWHRAELP